MSERTSRKNRDLLTDFQEDYAQAIVAARNAAELSATVGWSNLYQHFQEKCQNTRNEISEHLHILARQICAATLTEDELDELNQWKKAAVEVCEAAVSFDVQTVEPVRGTVTTCMDLITNYEQLAASQAAEKPLMFANLPDQLAEAIAEVPKPRWDARTGTVTVVEVDRA